MADYQVVNKPYPQVDDLSKVTGQRKYISDIRMPGLLWGKVVRSPYPHARIKDIDTSKALHVPGVRAVITAVDTPQIPCGPYIPDWEILAKEKVTFIGQEVAAVAALHPEAAEEVASKIEIEYEELPTVFDPEDAMAPGAPLIHEGKERNIANTFSVDKGDLETSFKDSDYVREGTFYPSAQFHAYLEPNGSIASYDPISGYTLWAATQVPYKARLLYSQALGVALEKLRLIQAPMGGAFGGKFESNFHLVAACLSKKAGRPVRLVNSLEEEFMTAPLRVPLKIDLKMGIEKDGSITAKEVEIVADNGARTNYGLAVLATACYRVDNLYRIHNTRAKGFLVYTNNVPKGAMRGFGNAEMLFAVESLLDMLAVDAGIDPGELRLKNTFKNGEVTAHGWVIGSCGLPECIKKAQEKSNWHEKKRRKASQSSSTRRGIGLACCNHVSGYRPILKGFDGSAAMVKVGPDGKIIVFTGEVDMGQGYTTVAAQCAAEELGVPLDWVEVASVDSQTSILGIGSLGSRGTLMGGNAVRIAAAKVREKILTAAGSLLGKDPGSLVLVQGKLLDTVSGQALGFLKEIISELTNTQAGQPFVGMGRYVPDTVFPDPETKYGNPSPAYSFAAHVAEVEVDTETAQVKVTNYVAANDVGKAINPLLVKGQLEGGVVQGMGYTLSENLIFHKGQILCKNLLDYKISAITDMPDIIPVIVEEEDPNGPYGAKSVGESSINPVVGAICNAIYDAVGVRITRLPVTPESLLKAIKAKEIARATS